MSGAPLGNRRLPGPFPPHSSHTTCCLHPGPLRPRGRGQSDLWLLWRPAGTVNRSVWSGDPQEAAEVFALLASPLDSAAAFSAAAPRDACAASCLCHSHRPQLYPLSVVRGHVVYVTTHTSFYTSSTDHFILNT